MPSHVVVFKFPDGHDYDSDVMVSIESISLWTHMDFIREVLVKQLESNDIGSDIRGRFNYDFFVTQTIAAIVGEIKKHASLKLVIIKKNAKAGLATLR